MKTHTWYTFSRRAYHVLSILMILAMALAPTIRVNAFTNTDKQDYQPGETVTIWGENSEGIVYQVGIPVDVVVTGPVEQYNCSAEVLNDSGYWECQVVLPEDPALAVGSYTYQTFQNGVLIEGGSFLDGQASADLDQCRNGNVNSPAACGEPAGGVGWVNGNVGGQNGHYAEGLSIPYRARMYDLPIGESVTLILGYDIKHSGAHAIDFLTYYDRREPHEAVFGHTAEALNPLDGVTGVTGPTTTYAIPEPDTTNTPVTGQPATRFNSLPAAEKLMTLYGGTLTGIEYLVNGDLTASQSETQIAVTFTVGSSTAVLAWGGHIARCLDWGKGPDGKCLSAAGISGSPYHMRLIGWNLNNLGQQDRSLKTDAIIQNGTIEIIKDSIPADGTDFQFSLTGQSNFYLDDDTDVTYPDRMSFSIPAGIYTAGEIMPLPAWWYLTSIVCTDPSLDTTVNLGAGTALINLKPAETVSCTFTNTKQQNADLTVSKTAVPSFSRLYKWLIDKSVDDTLIEIAEGGTATFNYSVKVTPDGYTDSAWMVDGKITVSNPNPFAVEGVNITDSIDNGGVCSVTGGTNVTVLANSSVEKAYSCTYTSAPSPLTGTNTATATWNKDTYYTPNGSASGTATADFSEVTPSETNKVITVIDDKTNPSSPETLGTWNWADGEHTFTYSLGLPGEAGTCKDYTNTAVIDETKQFDSQTVKVCVGKDLKVSKTAAGTFNRTYLWKISKAVDQTLVKIAEGGSYTFNYTVVAEQTGISDAGWTMSGKITISNPNDWEEITLTGLADVVDNGGSCTVDEGPYVIAKSGSLDVNYSCTYASIPSSYSGKNTATATWDKAAYFTPSGSAAGSADFTLTQLGSTNKTIHVTDTYGGDLGTVTATDTAPFAVGTFTYDRTVSGVAGKCTQYDNTATITETKQSADKSVTLCVGKNLTVTKTAAGSFNRTYHWLIDKSVDDTLIEIAAGGIATFNYTVKVTPNGYTDSGWTMGGTITVSNPNDWEDITADVTDAFTGGVCTVTGGEDVVIPAGESVTLNYSCTFATQPAYTGTNTATATWDKAAYFTPKGTASGTADVILGLKSETNRTIKVVDDKTDPLHPVTLGTSDYYAGPFEFTYSLDKTGVAGKCTDYTNTAVIDETKLSDSQKVTVCVGKDLEVSKTAVPTFTRTWDWKITKDYDATYNLFAGGSVTHGYKVTVTPVFTDSLWKVVGVITITNPNDWEAIVASVSDATDIGGSCSLDDPDQASVTVPASGSVDVAYTCTWATKPTSYIGTNTATVTWNKSTYFTPTGSATGSKGFEFKNPTEINPVITVDDDNLTGEVWSADRVKGEWTYTKVFACSTDPAAYTDGKYSYSLTNTAEIVETHQTDTAKVDVNCYAPVVTKDVTTYFNRDWDWTITKDIDATYNLFAGDDVTHGYKVTVTPTYTDNFWGVKGSITVKNNHPTEAMTLTSVSDLAGGIAGGVKCLSLVVPAAGSLTCTYDTGPQTAPNANPFGKVNTATAVFAGADWTGTAPIVFSATPTTEDEPVITVDDNNLTGEVWSADRVKGEWTYTKVFACSTDPAAYTDGKYSSSLTNTAEIVETHQTDTAKVDVNCYAPVISKTGAGTYDERHEWDVEKTVDPLSQNGFAGDTLPFTWTITVTESVFEENFDVAGTITVKNPAPMEMKVALVDVLSDATNAVIGACTNGATYVAGVLTIPANVTTECGYTANDLVYTDHTKAPTGNTATATLNDIKFKATATIAWTANVIRGEAKLTDLQKPLDLTITEGGTWTIKDSYTCSTERSDYGESSFWYKYVEDNTAVVKSGGEEQDQDSAETAVNCYWPNIDLTKSGDELSKKTDKVYYDIVLYNNTPVEAGLRALSCTISDPTIGFNKTVTLASGAKDENLDIPFTIPNDALDPFLNTASVTCKPVAATAPVIGDTTFSVSDSDKWSTNLFQPSINIVKTGDEYGKNFGGHADEITYTVTIYNTSSADTPTLNLYSYADAKLPVDFVMPDACKALAYGESCTFTYKYTPTVEEGKLNTLVNTFTAIYQPKGFPNMIGDVDDNKSNTWTVKLVHPAFTLAKTCAKEPVLYGAEAIFNVTFCNTGDADLVFKLDEDVIDAMDVLVPAGTPITIKAGAPCMVFTVKIPNPVIKVMVIENSVTASVALDPKYKLSNTWTETSSDACTVWYWGFTPGFWKNHYDPKNEHNAWVYTEFENNPLLGTVFDLNGFVANSPKGMTKTYAQLSMLEALGLKGGTNTYGALEILLRAGTAAVLNASFHETVVNADHPAPIFGTPGEIFSITIGSIEYKCTPLKVPGGGVYFPCSEDDIIKLVNAAILTHDRDSMLKLAGYLDSWNNGWHMIDWTWPVP